MEVCRRGGVSCSARRVPGGFGRSLPGSPVRVGGGSAMEARTGRSLGEDGLDQPCCPAEGAFAEAPLAALVLHINRELIHHLAEVSLLRDLYAHTEGGR
jgi:hypothetical protein